MTFLEAQMPIPVLLINKVKESWTNSYLGVCGTDLWKSAWPNDLVSNYLTKMWMSRYFLWSESPSISSLTDYEISWSWFVAVLQLGSKLIEFYYLNHEREVAWLNSSFSKFISFDSISLIIQEKTSEEVCWLKAFLLWGSICPELREVFTALIKTSHIIHFVWYRRQSSDGESITLKVDLFM